METPRNKSDAEILRQKAEGLLNASASLSVPSESGLPIVESELLKLIRELAFQNEEKAKRAEELVIANKELAFQNIEKEKRADELSTAVAYSIKLTHELQVHQIELEMQNEELRLSKYALFQSDAKHSSMISNISDVLGIIGVDCLIKYKSPNIEKWFGWKPHDLVGTDGWLTVHPDDLARVQKEFFTILEKDNSSTKVEYRYKCKDGSYKPIELTATNLINDPVIEGVLLNYHDISERKQIEDKLKLESSRLSLATRASGVGVWDFDMVNNILVWDDHMLSLYGIEKKDFTGKYDTWTTRIHPDDRERCIIEGERSLRSEKGYETEFRVTWPDGSVHIIRAIAIVHRDDSGKPLRMIGTNWDITELRKSEKVKLDDSENRYRSIFQGSSDGIIIIDIETKMIMFANSAQCEMLGYSEPQLQTMNIEALHPKGSYKDILVDFDKIVRGENTHIENIQCIRSNGEIFYADITSNFATINGKKCVVGFFRDITQRKLAEETVQKSEELLKTVVLNNTDLITLTDVAGFLLFVSPQCEAVLGYPNDKFIGIQIPDIIHPDDAEMVRLAWGGLFNDGKEVRELEYRIFDSKGAVRWLSHSAKTYYVNEIVIGVVSTIRNITDRKMAEQAIKASEEKYKTMLNATPECLVLTNMTGVIIEVSEIGVHLLGAERRDDLVGKDIFHFVPSDEHNLLGEMLVRTTHEGHAQNIGITVKRENQSVFAGEISATLMQDADGAPVSLMIIVRDISQRKKKEAKQIHTDRMSTLGEMAAGIAHEINQPLNIISMVMDRILFEIAKPEMVDIGFLKRKSDKIFENITRIRDIIDHVRAFSRSQDDGYIPSPFSVNSSIVNASSMIMTQFKHHGINLNLQLEQHLPLLVGNTYKFEQVILNMLANAKDAVTEKKSKSEEDFEMYIGIRSYEENERIFIDITDNGIGISHDNIKNIMLPFYTTKEEGKGTGLGLSISYQIIREMNGTIEITSDISTGTKFQLVLPVQKTK